MNVTKKQSVCLTGPFMYLEVLCVSLLLPLEHRKHPVPVQRVFSCIDGQCYYLSNTMSQISYLHTPLFIKAILFAEACYNSEAISEVVKSSEKSVFKINCCAIFL